MGPIKLDEKIMGQGKTWGNNYDSMEGCNHNTVADKLTKDITDKNVTLNGELDPSKPKPSNKNPGVDKAFWAKAEPQEDTTGHGKLSISKRD